MSEKIWTFYMHDKLNEKQHRYTCMCILHTVILSILKFAIQNSEDCYTKNDFLHRSFVMQNVKMKSFPAVDLALGITSINVTNFMLTPSRRV